MNLKVLVGYYGKFLIAVAVVVTGFLSDNVFFVIRTMPALVLLILISLFFLSGFSLLLIIKSEIKSDIIITPTMKILKYVSFFVGLLLLGNFLRIYPIIGFHLGNWYESWATHTISIILFVFIFFFSFVGYIIETNK